MTGDVPTDTVLPQDSAPGWAALDKLRDVLTPPADTAYGVYLRNLSDAEFRTHAERYLGPLPPPDQWGPPKEDLAAMSDEELLKEWAAVSVALRYRAYCGGCRGVTEHAAGVCQTCFNIPELQAEITHYRETLRQADAGHISLSPEARGHHEALLASAMAKLAQARARAERHRRGEGNGGTA